eukprot:gene19992-23924_t
MAKQYGLQCSVQAVPGTSVSLNLEVCEGAMDVHIPPCVGCCDTKADTEEFYALIAQKGEEGKRAVALFMPQGAGDGEAGSGTPTVPKYPVMQTLGFVLLPIPFAGPILGTFAVLAANYWSVAKYQAYFLQKIGAPTTPYSTVVLKQVITTVQNSAWDFNLNSHQIGQEVLYAELAAHGAQGYSLSAVFDDPSEKGDFNPRTMKSPICLVMQKPKDPSLALPRSFMIVNCPIHVEIDMGCCTAPMVHSSMPHLNNVLQMMATNRYRLGGCFLPKVVQRHSGCSVSYDQECQLIFEGGQPEFYTFAAVPCQWVYKIGNCCNATGCCPTVNNTFDLRSVEETVKAWTAQGWEPAAIINMPACRQQCCSHEISNEVMVIFQAVNTTITPASVVQVNPTTAPATLPGTSQAGAPPPVNQHTHVQLEAPAVEMASVGNAAQHMDSIMCPYCQMRLQNPPGVQAVTCPGCGNVIMTPE